ncbi:elongation of very long chain fatty acids protein AAEL008004 isoform X1 [Solenopsis invicta]|uniref:elongation of very long chain fatty acids protein AAEL008004 isoform X1 n=1 Tax=Solenopsis invicta TaxID=13686 RepID=UPI00193DD8E0|nr:elongation of very long chain fatty acids protein AAEL008004 isoform X1 [Solenopsis invicta]
MDILLNIHNSWKELDPRIIDLPLVASSYQVPLIIFAYLYFVLGCGPKFMKNRPPYKLKTFIQLYNIIQILANVWQIYDIIEAGLFSIKLICPTIDFSSDYIPMRFARSFWYYFLLKIWDLVETGIFVLRKKSNQVSGLHLYHHVSTLSLAWIGMRYYAVGQLLLVSITNNFVHVIMYIYYFLTTCGPTVQKPAAFIKQWITTVQMIQFVVLMMYLIHPLIVGCKVGTDHTNWFILVGIIDMAINLFNFRNFYQSSYKKSKKT